MGKFTVLSRNNLATMNVGDEIQESDYCTLTPDGTFVQLKYHEDEHSGKYEVKPGIWSIRKTMSGLGLAETSYAKDDILRDFVNTKNITDRIDLFFNRLHVYREHGIEVPKRAALLYGPPGTGKSTSIAEIANQYGKDGKTAIVCWSTDKLESWMVKDFFSTFEYNGVERLILIAEDIGGVEIDQVRMKSDASLLALLDNQEKVFTLPIYIIATTNFPEIFMGNLTNRPGRFDDKIEVPYPSGSQRAKLLEFFHKKPVPKDALDLIEGQRAKEFSAAHLREVVIRSAIYDKPMDEVILNIFDEIEHYNKAFSKQKGIGLSND